MICAKCNTVIPDESNFCPNCGRKCLNKSTGNSKQIPLNSDGKKHCRNCNKEIREGTLCKKCLRKMDQEQLTKEEQKQKKSYIERIRILCIICGVVFFIPEGILFMFIVNFVVGLIIAGIGILLCLLPFYHSNRIKPNSDSKKHCRNCNKEIRKGTLCNKCLRKLNQEQLTKAERKQKNDKIDSMGLLFACFGICPIIVGVIFMFSIDFKFGLIIAGVGVLFFLPWLLTRGSVCPACQRRKTMQRVHSELVGTRDTYVKETRKIYHTRKNGKTYINATPDYDEYEVDVPATEYFYDVTYKCSKCGHTEIQRESRTQKN